MSSLEIWFSLKQCKSYLKQIKKKRENQAACRGSSSCLRVNRNLRNLWKFMLPKAEKNKSKRFISFKGIYSAVE